MSFTTKIKNEVSNIIGTKSELIAELSGFIRNNGEIKDKEIILTTENSLTAERIINFFQNIYEISITKEIKSNLNFSKKELLVLSIKDKVPFILTDLGILNDESNYLIVPPEYLLDSDAEVRAYLRGVFLCSGSINDPKTSRYHMELLITKKEEAIFVQRLLNSYDLNSKILTRNKGYMIYIKEADKISDYLKLLNATKAVLYFENEKIFREKKNQANRLNNCEQANVDKIVETATKQLDYIKIIEANLGLNLLDDKTKETLEYRKKYPEASLKELSDIMSKKANKKITKSGLNHRFRKIKELAEHFPQEDK